MSKEPRQALEGFIIAVILVVIVSFFYYFVFVDRHSNELVWDIDAKIVRIGSSDTTHRLKSGNSLCTPVLFETITEPVRYFKLDTCSSTFNLKLNDEWLYNHRVGDTVHFKFLRKHRFFDIKEEYRKDLQDKN